VGGIYVVNIDGTGLKRIAPDGFNPEWSPDSKTHRLRPRT